MIKETCSCGAQIEINFGPSAGSREQTTISEWRREHKHERWEWVEAPDEVISVQTHPLSIPDPPEPFAKPGTVI